MSSTGLAIPRGVALSSAAAPFASIVSSGCVLPDYSINIEVTNVYAKKRCRHTWSAWRYNSIIGCWLRQCATCEEQEMPRRDDKYACPSCPHESHARQACLTKLAETTRCSCSGVS